MAIVVAMKSGSGAGVATFPHNVSPFEVASFQETGEPIKGAKYGRVMVSLGLGRRSFGSKSS
jgi:hypothetical protein